MPMKPEAIRLRRIPDVDFRRRPSRNRVLPWSRAQPLLIDLDALFVATTRSQKCTGKKLQRQGIFEIPFHALLS